ncbi:MAG: hypothetical protein ACI4JK_06945 [Oscillospiraceae bacterium]
MGMLKEMFGEEQDGNFQKREPVLLAKAKYKNSAEMIISGYKTFQKKYVYKNVFLKMLLVAIAIASSVLMLLSAEKGDIKPIMMIAVCVVIGVYFISQPIKNRKEVKKSAEQLDGSEYDIEITDQTIKIIMADSENAAVYDEDGERAELSDAAEEASPSDEENDEENKDSEEDNETPATIIHLNGAVDIIDRDDMFVIIVGKKYVFIVPQDVFSKEELEKTRHKLAAVMGIRYKIVD